MKCSICGGPIEVKPHWDKGNSAEPINSGRCCDVCDEKFVFPARLAEMKLNDIVASARDANKRGND